MTQFSISRRWSAGPAIILLAFCSALACGSLLACGTVTHSRGLQALMGPYQSLGTMMNDARFAAPAKASQVMPVNHSFAGETASAVAPLSTASAQGTLSAPVAQAGEVSEPAVLAATEESVASETQQAGTSELDSPSTDDPQGPGSDPGQEEVVAVPSPLLDEGSGETSRTEQAVDEVLYDWVSVDTYHANPPEHNALGRFEDRWYAAHSYTEIGACIAGLEEGDVLRVDGVRVRVSWIFNATYHMPYSEARATVGNETYCLQTCTGVDDGVRIAVCEAA